VVGSIEPLKSSYFLPPVIPSCTPYTSAVANTEITKIITIDFQTPKASKEGPPRIMRKGDPRRAISGPNTNYTAAQNPTTGIIATNQKANKTVPTTSPTTDPKISKTEKTKSSIKCGIKFQINSRGDCSNQNGQNKMSRGMPIGHVI
jgi:hypothetical protein